MPVVHPIIGVSAEVLMILLPIPFVLLPNILHSSVGTSQMQLERLLGRRYTADPMVYVIDMGRHSFVPKNNNTLPVNKRSDLGYIFDTREMLPLHYRTIAAESLEHDGNRLYDLRAR